MMDAQRASAYPRISSPRADSPLLSASTGTTHLEHFLEPLDVLPDFFEVRQKALLQSRIGGLICHSRQRLGELLLGVIDALQLTREQVVHGFDVFWEQSDRSDPLRVSGTSRRWPA
jgi:hypothetical protein